MPSFKIYWKCSASIIAHNYFAEFLFENIQVIEMNLLCHEKMSLMRQTMFYLIVQERATEVFTPFLTKGFTTQKQCWQYEDPKKFCHLGHCAGL